MKTKCKVCTVMCDISRGNELKACAFEHNGDENICPFDARYLDLSEHDKQIRADAIEKYVKTFCDKDNQARFLVLSKNTYSWNAYAKYVAEQFKEQIKNQG